MDTVSTGFGTDVNNRVSFAACTGEKKPIFGSYAESEHIDQRVAGIALHQRREGGAVGGGKGGGVDDVERRRAAPEHFVVEKGIKN